MSSGDVIAVYDAQAAELAARYDQIGLLESYAGLAELIAPGDGNALALELARARGAMRPGWLIKAMRS